MTALFDIQVQTYERARRVSERRRKQCRTSRKEVFRVV